METLPNHKKAPKALVRALLLSLYICISIITVSSQLTLISYAEDEVEQIEDEIEKSSPVIGIITAF